MLRFYGLDLWAELGGKRLPWGRLTRLLRQLPREAALLRAMHPEAHEWTVDTYLLASTVDLLAGANWQRSGGKGKRPKPIARPNAKNESMRWGNARGLDPAAVRARLDAKKPKRG